MSSVALALGQLEVLLHLLVDDDLHLRIVLLLVVELHVHGTRANDDAGDDESEEYLGSTRTFVHALLPRFKVGLFFHDVL